MKTVLGNIAVTATQKEMIMNDSYLQSSDCGFSFKFETIIAEIDPFADLGVSEEKNYVMTAELDAMGWISVGQIFAETKEVI